MTPAWQSLVGLPYREHGRGPDAYDCLGVMQAALGVTDTEPTDDWPIVSLRAALATPGAVILTRSGDGKQHVWTVLGGGLVLSASEACGVYTAPARLVARSGALVGCYLHREAPNQHQLRSDPHQAPADPHQEAACP